VAIDRPCRHSVFCPLSRSSMPQDSKTSFLEAALLLQAKEKDREARSLLMKRVR